MISIKNLCKTYHPKGGVSVQALNNVNLDLPETGMVFVIGKSGSGKSTFLNVLGGLDRYDSGEIIIKGKSSKLFTQGDFDSYRNTFVGFIFQEYNILPEFTVAKNVGLALELQGKVGNQATIESILEQVDLKGYDQRKPSELSGGQRQRVAIARALIKNPDIILADEPTGNLDSNTGRQVLETLRKLSKTKLVMVVSHDREYAEQFGDRIVEFADGVIINDTTKYYAPPQNTGAVNITDGKNLQIMAGQELTAADTDVINRFLKNAKADAAIRISESGSIKTFAPTKEVPQKAYDAKDFKLIRSRLPLKDSFRMGASGLKSKPVRLVFTVLLSVIALTLFGLADTLGSYNKVTTTLTSMRDSGIRQAVLEKQVVSLDLYNNYAYMGSTPMTKEDLTALNQKLTDFTFIPIFKQSISISDTFAYHTINNTNITGRFNTTSGFLETDQNVLNSLGFKIDPGYGRLPTNNAEVAISKHIYWLYTQYGYKKPIIGGNTSHGIGIGSEIDSYISPIQSPSDLLEEKLYMGGIELTIVGIIDTNFNDAHFAPLFEEKPSGVTGSLSNFLLLDEYFALARTSLHAAAFMKQGFYEYIFDNDSWTVCSQYPLSFNLFNSRQDVYSYGAITYSQIAAADKSKIIWASGYSAPSKLAENEVIVSLATLQGICKSQNNINAEDWDAMSESEKMDKCQQILGETYYFDYFIPQSNEIIGTGAKIIGVHSGVSTGVAIDFTICSDELCALIQDNTNPIKYAVAPLTGNNVKDLNLVKFSYETHDGIKYVLRNEVSQSLDNLNNTIENLSRVSFYVGIGFAVFAGLMIMNFIATSISHKKREIGILRAIGARSSDVFGIFFNESLIISLVNFTLAAIAVFGFGILLNSVLRRDYNILITLLHFGIRQLALILVVSVGTAFIASLLPTMRISNKKPIDAINNN